LRAPLILHAGPRSLTRAVQVLAKGGVIAYPTETLYGLGGPAYDPSAVARVFRIKGREATKPLPLIVADPEMAAEVAVMSGPARDLAGLFWPGPLTLVLRARKTFPAGVSPGGRLALRVSSHPVAQALARRLAEPLISTSANRSGRPGPVLADQVAQGLAADPPDLILENDPCPGGPGSTILDLTVTPPRILRAGAVPETELERFISGWA